MQSLDLEKSCLSELVANQNGPRRWPNVLRAALLCDLQTTPVDKPAGLPCTKGTSSETSNVGADRRSGEEELESDYSDHLIEKWYRDLPFRSLVTICAAGKETPG